MAAKKAEFGWSVILRWDDKIVVYKRGDKEPKCFNGFTLPTREKALEKAQELLMNGEGTEIVLFR